MGDAAASVISGACCAWCGTWFAQPHGFPVLCVRCWNGSDADERDGHQRATERER